MPTVALATCDWLPGLIPDDAALVAALEHAGVAAVPAVWSDPAVDWAGFDLVLVRTTWDYTARRDEFVGWAERVARSVPLWNPPETIRWNSEKSYLRDLDARGAPVVPTAWMTSADGDLAATLAERGWDDAIIKPVVGSGARGMMRVRRGKGEEHFRELLAHGAVLVQPFLPSIETEGELSVVCLDGEPAHAVRKRPQPGDIRIQPEYGGTAEPVPLDAELAEAVARVLGAVECPLLYARVDLVRDGAGELRVMELEAVEPRLFLGPVSGAGERVAAAVLERLP